MSTDVEQRRLMRQYLLGQLSNERRDQLEYQYLTDDILFEELIDVENELIDAYVRGNLKGEEKSRFDRHFLATAEKQDKVRFAKLLAQHVCLQGAIIPSQRGEETSLSKGLAGTFSPPFKILFRSGAALASIIFIMVLAWMVIVNLRLQRELRELTRIQSRLQIQQEQLREQISVLSHNPGPTGTDKVPSHIPLSRTQMVALLTLRPGLTRSGGQLPLLTLSPKVSRVRVEMILEDKGYSNLGVHLETVAGMLVFRKGGLRPRGQGGYKRVTVELPSSLFQTGDYILKLTAPSDVVSAEEITAYSFRVIQKN